MTSIGQAKTIEQQKTGWKLDPTHSSIEFSAKHLVVSTVKGRFGSFEVTLDANEESPELSALAVRIDAGSLETHDAQRDAHLRSADFLDVERHPAITSASRAILKKDERRFTLVGDLTIRDVTREVALDGTFEGLVNDPWGGQRAGFSASTVINRKDFGLTWNMALEAGGVLVGENIKIAIEVELAKAPLAAGAAEK